MDNPFKKRRTELITDRRTLLSLMSPVPIDEFLRADGSGLLEKLTLVVGTPGCGKTTIAQLLEFESLSLLCQEPDRADTKELFQVLTQHGLIKDDQPTVIAHRLAMTTNFRDMWELPYAEATRMALLRGFLQAKAVLGWFSQLESAGVPEGNVEIVMGRNADSIAQVTQANSPGEFRAYARDIELAIFRIVTALVPPSEQAMASDFLNTRYDVFEAVRGIRIRSNPGHAAAAMRPMVVVDDAHELHPMQFGLLRDWLKSKAMGVSRWLMCRPDIVPEADYREAVAKEAPSDTHSAPGSTRGRDYLMRLMQLPASRAAAFRPIATDIANRYIRDIPELRRRGLGDLRRMLSHKTPELADGDLKQLRSEVAKLADEAKFPRVMLDSLRSRIPPSLPEDEALATLRILLYRERARTPQFELLPTDEVTEEAVADDRRVASSLIEGARIQLAHDFHRPYYFGVDKLAAASNSNIEQFIRLTGSLVDLVLARAIRGKGVEISPKAQHDALVNQARQVMDEWDFPYAKAVQELVDQIARRCVEKTQHPRATLDDGANAIGVPQSEMDALLSRSARLARVLHFAFAYNALVYYPNYSCKKRLWCVLELGSFPSIAHGLTLGHGGFVEDTLAGLESMLPDEGQ